MARSDSLLVSVVSIKSPMSLPHLLGLVTPVVDATALKRKRESSIAVVAAILGEPGRSRGACL